MDEITQAQISAALRDEIEIDDKAGRYGTIAARRKGGPPYVCLRCDLPIAIFGRLMPCLHCLCYSCAGEIGGVCPVCKQQVKEVKKVDYSASSSVTVCSYAACQRTYLSEYSLREHKKIRHRVKTQQPRPQQPVPQPTLVVHHPPAPLVIQASKKQRTVTRLAPAAPIPQWTQPMVPQPMVPQPMVPQFMPQWSSPQPAHMSNRQLNTGKRPSKQSKQTAPNGRRPNPRGAGWPLRRK